MTAVFDHNSETLRRLISSCWEAHDGFRAAAESLDDSALKRLFGLYAQQRSRFAQELSALDCEPCGAGPARVFLSDVDGFRTENELLRSCLERERSALDLYRRALADRKLPTKARFLVSAQLALLERVHSRIEALSPRSPTPATKGERVTA